MTWEQTNGDVPSRESGQSFLEPVIRRSNQRSGIACNHRHWNRPAFRSSSEAVDSGYAEMVSSWWERASVDLETIGLGCVGAERLSV